MDDKAKKSDTQEVPVPEEFQIAVKKLLEGANKQQLSFVRDCCYQCEEEQRKVEEPEFTDKDMPT